MQLNLKLATLCWKTNMDQHDLIRLIWMGFKWLVLLIWRGFTRLVIFLAKNTFWWLEVDPADDKALRAAIGRSHIDANARTALIALTNETLPDVFTHRDVIERLLRAFEPLPNENDQEDEWLRLMGRLAKARGPAQTTERRNDIRAVMDLLYAFNRDEETALHNQIASGPTSSLTASSIKRSRDYRQNQMDRFDNGVAWFPFWQTGAKLSLFESCAFFLCLFGIIAINCFTEIISYSFGEYVGVARNGIQRPRTLYQIVVALFLFNLADGPFMWEIGRQRTLGASLSFLLFVIAYFDKTGTLYGSTSFVIGVAVGAIIFQTVIQLGDLAWFRIKCLRIAKEVRPDLTWWRLIKAWIFGRVPQGTQEDRDIHAKLAKLNARSVAWAKTYNKSKAMSLLWIEYAKKNAAPLYYYAARAGIFAKTVYNLHFFLKLIFTVLTLVIWGVSAYALWQQWQVFIIVMAFHTTATLKGLDLVFSQEQEVLSAANVWCNMVGAAIPALCGALLPRAVNEDYLSRPEDLRFIMPPTFVATFWTDLIAKALISGITWIFG